MLLEQISTDIVVATKTKDTQKRDILRVLKGEIERSPDKTDPTIVSIIKKMVVNITETTNDQYEVDVLSVYLPQQLTESEISAVVKDLIATNNYSSQKDLGAIMGYFKNNFNGQYDGKVLLGVVKENLV